MIKKGADANHRDRQGSYPLHMACLFQRTEVVKALLAAGADIEKQNAAGELPTKIANVTLKMKMLKFKETGNFGLAEGQPRSLCVEAERTSKWRPPAVAQCEERRPSVCVGVFYRD